LRLQKKNTQLPAGMTVVDLYTQLTDRLPESAVVLATPAVGWPLPTVKGKVVSLYHENPMLLDQDERYAASEAFFYSDIDEQTRVGIVRGYNVTHVLTRTTETYVLPAAHEWINQHAVLVAEVGNYRMYELIELGAPIPEPGDPERHGG
jgi:hypothetical protein